MARTNNKEVALSNPAPDDMEYPPFKVVLPAMAAIWLAFFVVALVNIPTLRNYHNVDNVIGSYNHRYRCTDHFATISEFWRYSVV